MNRYPFFAFQQGGTPPPPWKRLGYRRAFDVYVSAEMGGGHRFPQRLLPVKLQENRVRYLISLANEATCIITSALTTAPEWSPA